MTRDEKIAHMLDDLALKGINVYTAAPPLYRLMWRLGLDLTPPPFAGFATNALVMGTGFGIIWGLLMWPLASWTAPPWFAVAVTVIAGAAFGIAMATYYRWRMKPLGLPRWEDYPGVGTGTGTGH